MKHHKHSMLTQYAYPAVEDDLDLGLFDDRTLAGLVGTAHAGLDCGSDNDLPLRVLPLERWRDRR